MFRQKKLNRFLYRNVRAMSLYSTEPTHRGVLKNFKVTLCVGCVLYRDIARTFLYGILFSFF